MYGFVWCGCSWQRWQGGREGVAEVARLSDVKEALQRESWERAGRGVGGGGGSWYKMHFIYETFLKLSQVFLIISTHICCHFLLAPGSMCVWVQSCDLEMPGDHVNKKKNSRRTPFENCIIRW
jgi:hypothetical protein